MANLYLGQWEWYTGGNFPYWRAPGGDAISTIDFRSLPQMARIGNAPLGFGLFLYDKPRVGLPVNLGSDPTGNLTIGQKNALRSLLALAPTAFIPDKLIDAIFALRYLYGDPTGQDRWKPGRGSVRSGARIDFAGASRKDSFDSSHPAWNNTIEIFRADYRRERPVTDPDDPALNRLKKWTGAMMWQMGITDPAQILPPEFVRDGRLPPETTRLDDFTRGDQVDLGTSSEGWSWSKVTAGGINIVTNQGSAQNLDADHEYRADADLSTDDHYAQVDLATLNQPTTGASSGGPCCRFASAARTFYTAQLNNDAGANDYVQLYKRIAGGAFTQIGSNANVTLSIPDTVKIQIDSTDTLKAYFNGSEALSAASETSITGNLRTGLYAWIRSDGGSAGDVKFDNFEAADVAATIGMDTWHPNSINPYPKRYEVIGY